MPGELPFRTRDEAEAHLRKALGAGNDGDDGDDGDEEGDEGGDKGEGADKRGEVGGDKGGEKEGDTGGEKGGAGSKEEPRQPPSPRRRGNLRVATREWRPGGAGGLIGLTGLIRLTHQQVTRRWPAK